MPRMRAKVLQRQTSFPLQQDAGLAYLPIRIQIEIMLGNIHPTPEIEGFSAATTDSHKLKINTQMRQQASRQLRVAELQGVRGGLREIGETRGLQTDVAVAMAASSLIRNEDIYMAKAI